MIKLEFTIGRKRYERSLPSGFHEFSEKNLLTYCYFLYSGVSFDRVTKGMMFRMLDLPARIFFRLRMYQLVEILNHMLYLEKDSVKMENWLVKELRPGWFKPIYIGPYGTLEDIEMLQMADAESQYRMYHETKSVDHLAEMAAVLYYPVSRFQYWKIKMGFSFPMRPAYSRRDVDRHKKHLLGMERYQLEAVRLNFEGCLRFFADQFPNIPQSDDEGSGYGWIGLMHELAGDKLGTLDQVERSNAFKSFIVLDKICFDNKKQSA